MATERLRDLWERDVGAGFDRQLDELIARYQNGTRAYHDLSHVEHMLDLYERHVPEHPVPLTLAIWYHDAVYDATAPDNEERSADLARSELGPLGFLGDVLDQAAGLILATKTHEPASDEGAVLCDLDLAVFGSEPARYDRYAAAIRKEYEWVPEEAYRPGRAQVLKGFLDRPSIFRTEPFRTLFEAPARANLKRELETLA